MYNIKNWRHIFKLDPNKELTNEQIMQVCESGTDAIMVGGTDNIHIDDILHLLMEVRRYAVPVILEVSDVESITPGFDFYFIPTVLNAGTTEHIIDVQHKAIKDYGAFMNWEEVFFEGYCIANMECKAAKVTKAKPVTIDDIASYATLAEKAFRLPIFYLEYSGALAPVEALKAVREELSNTSFFYGGGITNEKIAREMEQFADTIIVGNALYENFPEAIRTVNKKK